MYIFTSIIYKNNVTTLQNVNETIHITKKDIQF